ncbi:putative uncharacterized protein [Clostridium sp. CAG:411]|nr:hemolysin family protein [Lachnospiraceae bacterium]CDE46006.1 putative uncharacterized protein [Clostridium sp. CAG:411]
MFEIKKYAISIIATIILIVVESMVSCGMAAFSNLSVLDIKKRAENGEKKAARLLSVMVQIEQYKSFVSLLMTTLNLAIGFIYSRRLLYWSAIATRFSTDTTKVIILNRLFQFVGMFLLVYLVFLVGNAIPGRAALKKSEDKAYRFSGLLLAMMKVFRVFVLFIEKTVYILFYITGRKWSEYQDSVTEEEIRFIVNEGLEQGVLENTEVEMISNIMEMDEKEVRDVMTRRTQIQALDGNITIEETIQFMLEESYSRFPVYEGDIDNIIGIVFWKDITKYYIQKKDIHAPIKKLAKKAYLVPDTQKVNVLFQEMQIKKISMAIAIDEYGQTVGIVAMEDILEEIVGNIYDEFDADERMIIKQREGRYFMRGLASLEDVAKELNLHMDKELEDYDTLNGFLISQIGHIPNEKEKVNIIYQGYEFRVVDIKDRMIRFVRVHKEEKEKVMP